jgi:crossover junction endodeoxyribonuclease RusA
MIRLSLPFPVSLNAAYANGGNKRGRHKTARYLAWEQLASIAIKDSHRLGIEVYSLAICLKRPDKRRRDLANLEKCVSDLLVSHGVIADDSGCERLTMQWDHGMKEECVVLVMPAEEAMAA